ncbi:MFS transporter [Thiothrix subterranea]|uniref:MFS transporter n=1 Tax=Thiothrix subterranea TaxID=2735563 RepID=A0AA51QZV2_9GAMM|nr:MFS transporter [Thiothrix subterranea]MDQ5769379.1 MFS transporter [Thiothrix subterranea]WML84999.1 MFS transporter [Thiothrix subterranea]
MHNPSHSLQHGIQANLAQILHQLLQVFLVGLTIGMTRTVVPGLAETEFGLGGQQFFLLTTFVVVFGAVKSVMNLFAGRFSDRFGRKRVLVAGWIAALPIPLLLLYAPNWGWVVSATALLGINQGLCWSMTLNSKLDMTNLNQKGLVNGMNEFSGYAAVALAGVVTAWLVSVYGARLGLFMFGTTVIVLGLLLAVLMIKETRPWALAHIQGIKPAPAPSLGQAFWYASWQNRNLLALNQAGLVEKFTDALVWIILPVWFVAQNLTLVQASSIIGVYALVWGASQLITGPASDRFGRKPLIVGGMWLCGIGVLLLVLTHTVWLWTLEAGLIGFGMAMLYPTLGAAVADVSPPAQRSTLLGVYRFWRDFGYAVGALSMGLLAQWTQGLDVTFWLVGVAMLLSGAWVALAFIKE